MKSSLIFIATLLSILVSMNVMALRGVYKWTDDRGFTHYTQHKPANYESVEVDAPPPPPSLSPDLNKPYANQIEKSAERSAIQKKQGKKANISQGDIDKRKQHCETARNNLKVLETQRTVTYKDSVGDEIRMGEDERQASMDTARKQIDFFCN